MYPSEIKKELKKYDETLWPYDQWYMIAYPCVEGRGPEVFDSFVNLVGNYVSNGLLYCKYAHLVELWNAYVERHNMQIPLYRCLKKLTDEYFFKPKFLMPKRDLPRIKWMF